MGRMVILFASGCKDPSRPCQAPLLLAGKAPTPLQQRVYAAYGALLPQHTNGAPDLDLFLELS